jgi:hypothetical protein
LELRREGTNSFPVVENFAIGEGPLVLPCKDLTDNSGCRLFKMEKLGGIVNIVQKFEAEENTLSNGGYACCVNVIDRIDLKGT